MEVDDCRSPAEPKVVFYANEFINHILSLKSVSSLEDLLSSKVVSVAVESFEEVFKQDQRILRFQEAMEEAKRYSANL